MNGQSTNAFNNRSTSQKSQDYDSNPKSIYMNKSNSIQQRKQIDNKNNVIMEMEAENNEDESYYMSNSPTRKNNMVGNRNFNNNGGIRSNNAGLSSNASNFGVEVN